MKLQDVSKMFKNCIKRDVQCNIFLHLDLNKRVYSNEKIAILANLLRHRKSTILDCYQWRPKQCMLIHSLLLLLDTTSCLPSESGATQHWLVCKSATQVMYIWLRGFQLRNFTQYICQKVLPNMTMLDPKVLYFGPPLGTIKHDRVLSNCYISSA